jgi:hypothetical protein
VQNRQSSLTLNVEKILGQVETQDCGGEASDQSSRRS